MGMDQFTIEQSELAAEFMLNALRLVEGVSFKVFEQQTGLPWISQQPTWQRLVENGLVRTDKICTTPLGLRYLDSVVAEFV